MGRKRKQRKPAIEGDTSSLPCEVIYTILSKLPVKSLLRFRCVCKSWRAIISEPKFAKSHLNESIELDRQRIFIPDPKFGCFYSIGCDGSEETLTFPTKKYRKAGVLCSCNGLVLLRVHNDKMCVLWNPSIREYKKFSCPSHIHRNYVPRGLCYDSSMDDYKVVFISKESEDYFMVFGFKDQCWTEPMKFPYLGFCGKMVVSKGVLHLVAFTNLITVDSENSNPARVANVRPPSPRYLSSKSSSNSTSSSLDSDSDGSNSFSDDDHDDDNDNDVMSNGSDSISSKSDSSETFSSDDDSEEDDKGHNSALIPPTGQLGIVGSSGNGVPTVKRANSLNKTPSDSTSSSLDSDSDGSNSFSDDDHDDDNDNDVMSNGSDSFDDDDVISSESNSSETFSSEDDSEEDDKGHNSALIPPTCQLGIVGNSGNGVPTVKRANSLNKTLVIAPAHNSNTHIPLYERDSTRKHLIVYFDMVDEKFKEMSPPNCINEGDIFNLTLMRGCLSLYSNTIDKKHVVIWTMKQYGEKNSWTKFIVIPRLLGKEHLNYLKPLCVTKKGEVVMIIDRGRIVIYNAKENEWRSLGVTNIWHPILYVDSLVLPIRTPQVKGKRKKES